MGHTPTTSDLSWGLIAQAAVGALLIILLPILRDDHPCLVATAKPLPVQALIAEFADDTLRRAVLPRLARLDKRRADAVGRQPGLHRLGHQRWAIVAADVAGGAMGTNQACQGLDDRPRGDSAADLDRQTHSGLLVHDH